MARIFVYGTLKRGHGNHHYLAGQKFVGEAVTVPKYRLIDLGSFPGLFCDDPDGLEVRGEVWDVDETTLARLDQLEGYDPEDYAGSLYWRESIDVPGFADVQAYFITDAHLGRSRRTGAEWPFTGAVVAGS
jgi:gamma-glutamylcyclotransferase (GGCT)/AIG2-like uncharacterized protein YtfP